MTYFATVSVRKQGALGCFYPCTFCLGVEKLPDTKTEEIGLIVDTCYSSGYEVERILYVFGKELPN